MLWNFKAAVVKRRNTSLYINSIVFWRGITTTKLKGSSCELKVNRVRFQATTYNHIKKSYTKKEFIQDNTINLYASSPHS